jgi:hypothetical protein
MGTAQRCTRMCGCVCAVCVSVIMSLRSTLLLTLQPPPLPFCSFVNSARLFSSGADSGTWHMPIYPPAAKQKSSVSSVPHPFVRPFDSHERRALETAFVQQMMMDGTADPTATAGVGWELVSVQRMWNAAWLERFTHRCRLMSGAVELQWPAGSFFPSPASSAAAAGPLTDEKKSDSVLLQLRQAVGLEKRNHAV